MGVSLFDLRQDPDEANNLIGRAEHAPAQAELDDRLHAFFARYAEPRFDLWRGGASKTGVHAARTPRPRPK